MSSTNKTLTIELSQYVGTDKPTYLTDYNGDMLKIDNAIAADRDSIATAQSKADGADAKADTNAGAISDLDAQVNNASNGLTKRVTDVEGDVNTIESLIGNGTPTTTDKTIIGAINELDSDVDALGGEIGAVARRKELKLSVVNSVLSSGGFDEANELLDSGTVAPICVVVTAPTNCFGRIARMADNTGYIVEILDTTGTAPVVGTNCTYTLIYTDK